MSADTAYEALTVETLPERLKDVTALTAQVGEDPALWQVEEVGDGNLNLVFIVTGPGGKSSSNRRCPMCALSAIAGLCPCTAPFSNIMR